MSRLQFVDSSGLRTATISPEAGGFFLVVRSRGRTIKRAWYDTERAARIALAKSGDGNWTIWPGEKARKVKAHYRKF